MVWHWELKYQYAWTHAYIHGLERSNALFNANLVLNPHSWHQVFHFDSVSIVYRYILVFSIGRVTKQESVFDSISRFNEVQKYHFQISDEKNR